MRGGSDLFACHFLGRVGDNELALAGFLVQIIFRADFCGCVVVIRLGRLSA